MSEADTQEDYKPRRRQIDTSDSTQTLLNSLTLEQIREALYRLAPRKKINLRTHSASLEALLQTGKKASEIEEMLLEVERAYPFKHCLLLRLLSSDLTKPPALGDQFAQGEYIFKLSHISNSTVLSLTFEHSVEFTEWIEVEQDTRKRRKVQTRQPIVVRVEPDRKLVTLSYPGFTHNGSQHNAAAGYEPVVEALLAILKRSLNLSLKTLPIKSTLAFFLQGPNKRVLRVKADVDSPLARLDMSAKGKANNIEDALASFLSDHLSGVDKSLLVDAAKNAFNNATLNSIVLFWLQEGLFTRLRFWDIGTELFFVWNKESASYRTVDAITQVLSETADVDGNDNITVSPIAWISKCPPHVILSPAELAMTLELAPGEARTILIRAMNAGLVEPVYRVTTSETLVDFPNDWTPDLQRLKKMLKTVSGRDIDGQDPTNIEVAFRRIGLAASGGVQ